MKKVLLLILSAWLTTIAFAATAVVDGITWTYSVSSGKATIGTGSYSSPAVPTSTTGAITIPSTLGGYPVTSIGDYAFRGCSGLTSVTIPSSVTSIGEYAFYYCDSLTSVTIPQGIQKLTRRVFSWCTSLESVVIPEGVTEIGESAFDGCYALESITIPESIKSIGMLAFWECQKLTSIQIPSKVTTIGERAFESCNALERVYINDVESWLKIQFGSSTANPLYYADEGLYLNGEKLTSVTIPEGVTSISDYAFRNCSGLTSVVIPSSVTSIGDWAFSGCPNLKITVDSANTVYASLDGALFNKSMTELFRGPDATSNYTIPEGVTSISNYAFSGCSGLTSVTIPSSVKSIGEYAFYGCGGLTSVTISEGVTSIGDQAFRGCSGLTSVTIPSSVTSIGDYAFYNCSGLTSVTIPSSVTSIGDYAFSGCSGLTSVTISEGVKSIGNYAFFSCSGLTSVTIPSSVMSIGARAFSECTSLEQVKILNGVTSIGGMAFRGCTRLSVNVPSSVTSVGDGAFYQCRKVYFEGDIPSFSNDIGISKDSTHFSLAYAKKWEEFLNINQGVRGTVVEAISLALVTVSAEMTTPKTMKVTYTIHSETCDKAKVYALAFEDGVRSFAKVVPVKTAATDSPEAVPNGREVTTNEPHTFIWNVPADWDTDLAKVMVEILVQEGELLPMELATIPGDATTPTMTISQNALSSTELFNALLWCYATGDTALTNTNGIVKVNGTQIANGTSLYSSYSSNCNALLNYLYGKMGFKVLSGADLTYAEEMTELDFSSSGLTQVAVKIEAQSTSEE